MAFYYIGMAVMCDNIQKYYIKIFKNRLYYTNIILGGGNCVYWFNTGDKINVGHFENVYLFIVRKMTETKENNYSLWIRSREWSNMSKVICDAPFLGFFLNDSSQFGRDVWLRWN